MPETDPSITPRCPACGSDAIVPDVVLSIGGAYTTRVAVNRRPSSIVNKQQVVSEATWRACSDCGLVMVFADEPSALWHAHIERLAHERDV